MMNTDVNPIHAIRRNHVAQIRNRLLAAQDVGVAAKAASRVSTQDSTEQSSTSWEAYKTRRDVRALLIVYAFLRNRPFAHVGPDGTLAKHAPEAVLYPYHNTRWGDQQVAIYYAKMILGYVRATSRTAPMAVPMMDGITEQDFIDWVDGKPVEAFKKVAQPELADA